MTYRGHYSATYKADEEGNLWHRAVVMQFLPDGKIKVVREPQHDMHGCIEEREKTDLGPDCWPPGLRWAASMPLVGLGFILIYNATGGLNFAQGELVMLSAFVFYAMVSTGAPCGAAALATIALMAVSGFVFQRLFFYPLRNRSFLAFIIATIGVSIRRAISRCLVWGPFPLRVPSFFSSDSVAIGKIVLAPEHLLIIAVTAVVLLLQYWLFFYTDLGRRLRAAAQNGEVAQLMGIRVEPDDRHHLRDLDFDDGHGRGAAGTDLLHRYRNGSQSRSSRPLSQ